MSAPHEQENAFEMRTLRETNEGITVQVGRGTETVVFTYTPPYKVAVDFPGKEAPITPEHPAITIEGNPAFKHKLKKTGTRSGLPIILIRGIEAKRGFTML